VPPTKLDAPPEPPTALPEQPAADVTTDTGPRLPADRLGRRLLWAILVSVLVNAALWRVASQVVRNHILAPPPPLTFRRIILPPKPHRPKSPKPKLHKKIVVIRHRVMRAPPRVRRRRVVHRPPPRHAPPPAHHRILTAKGPTAARHTALPGGHARLGRPIEHQNVGEGRNNNQPPTPQPQPRPEPQPQPRSEPPSQPEPRPQPPPEPRPEPPPPPAGPTQDAQPANQVYPDIPDELKNSDYQSHVRVRVEIAADGSFTVSLVTSSGNEEIDQRVLDALKHWKWKPALQNGQPIASTQRFRFNFEVH